MLITCFTPVAGIEDNYIVENSYAASDTNKDGTYAGSLPTLPNGIAKQAIKCAWPYNTTKSTFAYSGGKATPKYNDALQNAYPDRSGWGKAPKAGASCDVFVGTIVRSSGYDRNYPRGLSEQYSYVSSSSKFEKVSIDTMSDYEPGDIVLFKNKSGNGGHTCIYVERSGNGYFAEAHYNKYYGSLYRKAKVYRASDCGWLGVFRATETCQGAFTKGDYSADVRKLQMFLNWAGFDCGTPDGDLGDNTVKAITRIQKAVGLEADGEFGSQSLAATAKYTKVKVASTKKSTAFSGKLPTSIVNKKNGSKTNIKRWQSFLKWYGYPMTTGGKFGPATIKYTKKFQKVNGLTADGSAGPKTIKKAKTVKK